MKRKIIIGSFILATLGGAFALYEYNRPMKQMANESVDTSINASDLLQQFEADENAANQKYLDKIIEINGEVEKVEHENGKTNIHFKTESMMFGVICELEKEDLSLNYEEGKNVVVKAVCTGFLSDVILIRGIVIEEAN